MASIFRFDFGHIDNTDMNRFEIEGYEKDVFNAIYDL